MKPDRPLRVLQVFSNLGVSGAEIWLIEILRHLRATKGTRSRPVEIDVCLTSGERDVLDDEAAALGARLFYHRYSRRDVPAFAQSFRRLLRSGRYDAIHDHQDHVAGLHLSLGFGLLPPVRAVHYHNPLASRDAASSSFIQRRAALLGRSLVKRLATHVLGTSEHTLREFGVDQRHVSAKVQATALHCGFRVDAFRGEREPARAQLIAQLGWPATSRMLLFVGRLSSHSTHNQKNPWHAIEVAAAAMKRDRNVHALLAGGSSEADAPRELAARVESLGLSDRFAFLGPRRDIPQLMLASDLLLFPSLAEGLGMVSVEAQATGLPVLASTEVPEEGTVVPGLVSAMPLVAGVDAWASRVLQILAAPQRDPFACNDIVSASRFSIQRSVSDLLTVYSGQRVK